MNEPTSSQLHRLLLASFKGVGLGLLLGIPLYYLVSRAISYDAGHQWRKVPIVAAAVDLPAGVPVTMEMITQRAIPAKFLHDDFVVTERSAALIGKVPQTAILAGEPMSWALVGETLTAPRIDGPTCVAAFRASLSGRTPSPGVNRLFDALEGLRPGP